MIITDARNFSDGLGPQNLVFSNLATVDLLHLSQTCRTIRTCVHNTCFNINNLLSPYLGQSVDSFRRLQEDTGTLISGSTALLFFLRTSGGPESWVDKRSGLRHYFPSLTMSYGRPVPANQRDLDVYVEHRYAPRIAKFLENAGYTYSPRALQAATWRIQLTNTSSVEDPTLPKRLDVGYYLGRGIQDVLDFYHEKEDVEANINKPVIKMDGAPNIRQPQLKGMKIQLITTKRSPMDVILTFHSSKSRHDNFSTLI